MADGGVELLDEESPTFHGEQVKRVVMSKARVWPRLANLRQLGSSLDAARCVREADISHHELTACHRAGMACSNRRPARGRLTCMSRPGVYQFRVDDGSAASSTVQRARKPEGQKLLNQALAWGGRRASEACGRSRDAFALPTM